MIHLGDCLSVLKGMQNQVDCCVTSPPYWGLRDYGVEGQLGLEKTPEEYVSKLVEVFREVKRVLKDDGTLWLNLGDSYMCNVKGKGSKSGLNNKNDNARDVSRTFTKKQCPGIKHKDLVGIPWRVAFALQADGWYLRQDIIWNKPNPMPESVRDRCTKAHEYIFLLSKKPKYYFDHQAIKEPAKTDSFRLSKRIVKPHKHEAIGQNIVKGFHKFVQDPAGRNKRSVWTVTTKPFKGAHFATFPPDLIEPCILAGCPKGGTILDPFFGAGTVGLVALKHDRKFIGIEINPAYIQIAQNRIIPKGPA